MNLEQRAIAYAHIRAELPALDELITATGEVPLPIRAKEPVADALVRIVAGQMLSRSAAQSIVSRVKRAADRVGCSALHQIPEQELIACGLSKRKAKTINLIAQMAGRDPNQLESWRDLSFDELRREVSEVWGLADWSASMLGIFYFAHPDIFPTGDGSLIRAIRLVEHQVPGIGKRLRHEAAAPYRSFLALTLWSALDNGHLGPASEGHRKVV